MLLIDSGNSAIKCRLIKQDKVIDQTFSIHDDKFLTGFRHYLSKANPGEIVLASVSDEKITQEIKVIASQNPGSTITQLTSLVELGGLKNGYEDYKQLGVDRWLTLLAAIDLVKGDAFIVDAGSAITIDLLSFAKGHLGGAILAGFNTPGNRFEQLFPAVDFNHPDICKMDLPGKSTQSCIYVSDHLTTIKQIKNLLLKWQYLLQKPISILLCGQDSELISQQLGLENIIVPDLVFKGMLKQIQLQG